MNNLTTRKIVLGMLMALVLMFSVQGIADAQITITRTAGDLQLKAPGDTFTLSFNVAGVLDSDSNGVFDANQSILLGVVNGITVTKIDNVDATDTTLNTGSTPPSTAPNALRNGSYTITYLIGTTGTAITAGKANIDIHGSTTTGRFVIYIAPSHNGSVDIGLSSTDGVEFTRGEVQIDDKFTVGNSVRVKYTVSGSGILYVADRTGDRRNAGTSLTISKAAEVHLNITGTVTLTASIVGQRADRSARIIYIYDYAILTKESGDEQKGAESSSLTNPLVVKVTDGNTSAVSGVEITFATRNGGSFIRDPNFPSDLYVPKTGELTGVKTNASGLANVFWILSGSGEQAATATLTGSDGDAQANTPMFTATFGTEDSTASSIVIESGDGQTADEFNILKDPLVATVRDELGQLMVNAQVEFLARDGGSLTHGSDDPGTEATTSTITGYTGTAFRRVIFTDSSGQASVRYTPPQGGDRRTVRASIVGIDRSVIFTVNGAPSSGGGGGGGGGGDDDTPPPVTASVPSSVSGAAGSSQTLTITAPAAATVTVGVPADTFPFGSASTPARSGTTFTSRLTLPSQTGTYSLSVYVNTTRYPVTVSVTAAAQTDGTLTVRIDPGSGAPGSTATVTVTATNANGTVAPNIPVTLRITSGGGSLSPSAVTTGATGTATSTLTRGSTVGSNYFVTVSSTSEYTHLSSLSSGERVVISGTSSGTSSGGTVGAAAEVDVYDGNNQDGSLNSRLAEPFIVEVVDANDNPVEDARVRFRTTIGSGRFSPRTPRTDEDGFAETTFTPTSTGRIRVVATVTGVDSTAAFIVQGGEPADALEKVSGDNQSGTPGNALANPFVVEVQDEDGEPLTGHSVTFSVTAGGGSLSETSVTADEDGRAQTRLTLGSAPGVNSVQASVSGVDSVTFSTSIDAKILVVAANRPVMYWIAGGGLYSLSGAKEAKIAESANGVAVGGGKIYWTSQVNASSGTINSANLDGTGVATVTSIQSVPVGIAVDTAGSKLYWTNARGRIQSASLNGSGIQNVMQNLSAPTDIVVSNGFIYWTEGGNSVRRVNIRGQKIAIDVAVNLGTVGGLAVGSGKVYWTEQTSASAGTVNGANLNGTNFETLATLQAAPMGISVDTAGSKLYWTNARGRVQSANLNGSMIKTVVEGLISPSKIAIGGANTAVATIKSTTPAKKDNAKYDVNGDGAVDNTDASLVAAAMNTSNTKYDVNGDGTVNFLDLLLVFDNREDAAAAPTIVGMKLTAIQIDIIQEQIDLLIATNDRSPAALRTLVYMQQLLVTARPEKTQLFANYPNPFNPETWLPYELATDTHVKITIYNTQGVVIRTLQFGHQSAGYYTDRDRAAYWDGRNALGEQVASGLYFYQLETDMMSSMRKMVILK